MADRIRKLAPFTSSVAVTAAIGVVRGLDAFHKAGLAHGDVSGENVAMLADGDTRLQLGGIWTAYPESQTAGSIVLPSLAPYLAPEVSTGGLPSPASDLYSVGVLLFELLTGRKPYQAETAVATAMKHATDPTPRVRSLNSSVPTVLDEIVYKAMAKDPHSRYTGASELLFDLRQVQDAVRFGRTLSWPIRAQSAPAAVRTPQPVAPRMSAVRERPDPEVSSRKSQEERDVPVWMLVMFTAVLSMCAVLLGFLVFFNVTRPQLVKVPRVSNMTVQDARTILEKSHLVMREGPSVPSESVAADQIISTEPPADSKVTEHSTVVVTVSTGSTHVKVPNLKGLHQDKAAEYLARNHLTLDTNVDHESTSEYAVGEVSKQTPIGGSDVLTNSQVHITVRDAPSDAQSKPAANADAEPKTYPVTVRLDDLTQPTIVKIDVQDDDDTGVIHEDHHEPGDDPIDMTTVARGSNVKVRVYYDDKKVKEFTLKPGDAVS